MKGFGWHWVGLLVTACMGCEQPLTMHNNVAQPPAVAVAPSPQAMATPPCEEAPADWERSRFTSLQQYVEGEIGVYWEDDHVGKILNGEDGFGEFVHLMRILIHPLRPDTSQFIAQVDYGFASGRGEATEFYQFARQGKVLRKIADTGQHWAAYGGGTMYFGSLEFEKAYTLVTDSVVVFAMAQDWGDVRYREGGRGLDFYVVRGTEIRLGLEVTQQIELDWDLKAATGNRDRMAAIFEEAVGWACVGPDSSLSQSSSIVSLRRKPTSGRIEVVVDETSYTLQPWTVLQAHRQRVYRLRDMHFDLLDGDDFAVEE